MSATSRAVMIGQSEFRCPCHACAFFHSRDEEYDLLLPFSKAGAEAGERLFQVVDKRTSRGATQAAGWRPASTSRRRRGRDSSRSGRGRTPTCAGNRFDQHAMLELIQEVLKAGRSSGFPMTRLWANMEWALDDLPGVHDIVEYETRLNHFLPNYDDVVVCTYDLSKFSAPVVMDIMRTHPQVIIGGAAAGESVLCPPRRISRRVEPPAPLTAMVATRALLQTSENSCDRRRAAALRPRSGRVIELAGALGQSRCQANRRQPRTACGEHPRRGIRLCLPARAQIGKRALPPEIERKAD